MTLASKGISALGKLGFVIVLLAAFGVGMAAVVYVSLSGKELTVPEIVGKDYVESEKELEDLGLKIKRRADRASTEKINTVLEQLPKAGETVKTGQMILVVVSKAGIEGEEVPSSLKKNLETDDAEKIEEMISDKPKKPKANSNTNRKKVDTTRDVIANSAKSNTSDSGSGLDPEKDGGSSSDKGNRNTAPATPKAARTPAATEKVPAVKPPAADSRQRPNPKP